MNTTTRTTSRNCGGSARPGVGATVPTTRAGRARRPRTPHRPSRDQYALAAYDARSEGRAMRSAQDQEAEASHKTAGNGTPPDPHPTDKPPP
ncbi:hypothetical protein QJS66_02280 [Kocuria rhizophila]|nr:hypothetical protein QJS66_02280 [Kocuria rhizophila]